MRFVESIIEFTTDIGHFALYRLFGENPRNVTKSESKLLYHSDLDTINRVDVNISFDFNIIGSVFRLTEEQCRKIIPADKMRYINKYSDRKFLSAKEAFDDVLHEFEIYIENPYSDVTLKKYKEAELKVGQWIVIETI